jgi:hypothetical protein
MSNSFPTEDAGLSRMCLFFHTYLTIGAQAGTSGAKAFQSVSTGFCAQLAVAYPAGRPAGLWIA